MKIKVKEMGGYFKDIIFLDDHGNRFAQIAILADGISYRNPVLFHGFINLQLASDFESFLSKLDPAQKIFVLMNLDLFNE